VNTTIDGRLYSSVLTTSSRVYAQTGCSSSDYYEALQLNIVTTGVYRFSSNSSVDLNQYVYQNAFHPVTPSSNLLAIKPSSSTLPMSIFLRANITYVLVMTTATPYQTGPFSVYVKGPIRIGACRLGKSDCSEIPRPGKINYNQFNAR
jgi:hypothetical protein